jgi:hypothetical protein
MKERESKLEITNLLDVNIQDVRRSHHRHPPPCHYAASLEQS